MNVQVTPTGFGVPRMQVVATNRSPLRGLAAPRPANQGGGAFGESALPEQSKIKSKSKSKSKKFGESALPD